MLARHVVPRRLAEIVAEADGALAALRDEEDAPAVVGHAHVVVGGPPLGIDADGRAQIHVVLLEAFRTDVAPPGKEIGLPLLQRPLQAPVAAQVDVVRNGLEGLGH